MDKITLSFLFFCAFGVQQAHSEPQRGATVVSYAPCYISASEASPNPQAVLEHENWHCWGWVHPETTGYTEQTYQAPIAPWYVRIKGWYPNIVFVQYKKGMCEGHFGCQSFQALN